VASCHEPAGAPTPTAAAAPVIGPSAPAAAGAVRPILFGLPMPALVLATALGAVATIATAWIVVSPFDSAAFGGLTVPIVLASGVADGLNPCAFALLVLFATFTLTLANRVTSGGAPADEARRRLLGAGSIYVGAVWITYLVIGLGLFAFLGWLGQDHLVTRIAAVVALLMALWMLKDVFLPGLGPAMVAPAGTHGRLERAVERGGLGGMLLAGVLVGICTVPCSGAIYLDIVAVLSASGGGATGLALLSLYTIAYIAPLAALLIGLSDRRVLGRLGRWNGTHGRWVKLGLAVIVIGMSLTLLYTL